jgi:hypothetical protein
MAPLEDEREFRVRYYRWALEQSRLEVERGFPLLRGMTGPRCRDILEIVERADPRERQRILQTLTKMAHREAREALGEAVSPDETAVFQRMIDLRRAAADRRRRKGGSGLFASLWQKRIPRSTIRNTIQPVLGRAVEVYRDRLYSFEAVIGRWLIVTEVYIEDKDREMWYRHIVRSHADRSQHLIGNISIALWLGVSGQTRWADLRGENVVAAAESLAAVCSRFLEATPHLLPE